MNNSIKKMQEIKGAEKIVSIVKTLYDTILVDTCRYTLSKPIEWTHQEWTLM